MNKFISNVLILFMIALFTLSLDAIYLSSLSKYFAKVFQNIQGHPLEFRISGAIFCYIFIVLSIYYFGFYLKNTPFSMFLLGFFTYGIYELTNYATIKKWPLFMVLTDTLWGGVLYMSVFIMVHYFVKRFIQQ